MEKLKTMELAKYFREFDEANKAQDHYKMMATMQKFFNEIHHLDEENILAFYSMAQQFELLGMNTKPIKDAVIARVKAQYAHYSATWRDAAIGLNSLLEADNRYSERITIKSY